MQQSAARAEQSVVSLGGHPMRVFSRLPWLLSILTFAGCRHPLSDATAKRSQAPRVPAMVNSARPPPSAAASASTSTSAPAPALGLASAGPAASGSDTASAAEEHSGDAACRRYTTAMAKGRAATKAARYDEAIAAFDRAVRARPVDARARAERGFAYLSQGAAERALADLDDASLLTQERSLLAQIYLNLAVASAKLNLTEAERIALVLASRRGSAEARTRLAERSPCPALWRAQLGKAGPIARNFRELVEPRPLVGCDYHREQVQSEADARRYVCHGCTSGLEDAGDQCSGPGPWSIASGYMNFQVFEFFVAPLPGGLFFYADGSGSPYRVQAGHLITESRYDGSPWRKRDQGGVIRGRFAAASAVNAEIDEQLRWSDEDDAASICELRADDVDLGDFRGTPMMPLHGPLEYTAYSLRTKHERFTLTIYDGSVSLTIEANRARVRGEGCDAEIPLPADP